MNDTAQTPTDQPSELDAIRARVDARKIWMIVWNPSESRYYLQHLEPQYGDFFTTEQEANNYFKAHELTAEYHVVGCVPDTDSRRLLELLDERDEPCDVCAGTGTPISGYPCICGGSGKAIDSIPHFREVIYEKDSEIESLRRELTEAREKALEEAATLIEDRIKDWGTDGDLIRGYKNHAEGFIKAIRSLKPQPTQTQRQSPESQLKEARELMREWYDGLPTYDLAWMESLKIRVKNFISNN